MSTKIHPEDVNFNPTAIAAAWEAAENTPVCVAVAITNEFTDHQVIDGVESDRDVEFENVLFEEKAVGICDLEIAKQYAPAHIELEDGRALAINPQQIFTK